MVNQDTEKRFYKRWWFWVGMVTLFVIGVSDSSTMPQKVGENATDTAQEQTVFKIGDQIKINKTILAVTGVNRSWTSSNQFDTPSNPGSVFVVVTVSLENQGNEQLDLSGFWDFKLQDNNGLIHDQSIGGIGLKKLSSGSLAAGGKTDGDIIFEVPRDAVANLKLLYKPLSFSQFNQTVSVELQ